MAIVDQVLEERAKIGCNLNLSRCYNRARFIVDHRIDVELQAVLEHAAERFENSALEIEIIFFVENFDQARYAHDQANHAVGVTRKISGQSVVFAELRDQDRSSKRAENIDSRQKI